MPQKLSEINATVSNAIWVKKSDLTPKQLEAALEASHIYGKEKYLEPDECHEAMTSIDRGRYLGLPRGIFDRYFTQEIKVTSKTVKWPEWEFPDGWDWRPGQEDSVDALLSYFEGKPYGQGRLEAACGTGKTAMSLYVASKLGLRTLILVHKEDLAKNFHKDAKTFLPGIRPGHCQQDSWVFKNCHFTTATFQTLYARQDQIPAKFFERFGLVITDEAHRVAAQTFEQVIKQFTAKYRLSVSATWRRRDGLEKVFDAHLGPIVHTASSKSLKASFTRPSVRCSFSIVNPRHWAYVLTGISESVEYKTWLVEQAVRAVYAGRAPLILADRIKMLKDLEERINDRFRADGFGNKKARLYIGESTNEAKKRATKNAAVVLGSYGIFNEGTDVPRLDTLFIGTPRSDIEQAAGRIRRIKDGKKPPLIIDPQFPNLRNPMVRGSAFARLKQYQSLGFVELKGKLDD